MLPITCATINSFCHVCMLDHGNSRQNIYEIKSEQNLPQLFKTVCDINEHNFGVSPTHLCRGCYVKVHIFNEFRQKSICSSMVLNELLSENLSVNMVRNLKLFCRTCLKKVKTIANLPNIDNNIDIRNWMLNCTGIKLDEVMTGEYNDQQIFPSNMCIRCFTKLRNFIEFRRVAKQSFEYLKSVLGKDEDDLANDVKTEVPKSDIKTEQEFIFAEQLPVIPDEKTTDSESEYDHANDDNMYNENNDSNDATNSAFNYLTVLINETNDRETKKWASESEEEAAINIECKTSPSDLEEELPYKGRPKRKCRMDTFIPELTTDEVRKRKVKCAKEKKERKRKESKINQNLTKDEIEENNILDEKDSELIQDGMRKKKTFKCEKCEKIFRNKEKYEAHINFEHKDVEKPYPCEFCENSYRLYSSLRRHTLKVHINSNLSKSSEDEKLFMCEICCKAFKRTDHLRDHINAVHYGLRPFKCKYCDKSFAARKTCRVHEMSHTGDRPFSCDLCDRSFRQKTLLKIHMEIHTTSTDLLCPICKRARPSVEELREHVIQHEMTMQHQCSKCGKIFRKKSNMYAHDKRMHSRVD
ncbi:zinc finger protein 425-like [Teleopsis dalmanni]|uniref:zinc finger protein 425-like n=1 Tax=Teleopsis dalmanni TaxID=139649 RepID=UPI0018CDC5D0|nr:zinc finger protein 425-like [Teleopsis dalmanni]